jgi:polar amino acid transport system substrate-binding protein
MRLLKFGLLAVVAMVAGLATADALSVKVGVTDPPYGFVDPPGSPPQGYSVDVMNAVAKEAGIEIEVVYIPTFPEVIPALLGKKIDVSAADMFVTDARKAMGIDFAQTFAVTTDAMLVNKKDMTEYKSFDDLKGQVVGTVTGYVYVEGLQKGNRFKEVKIYKSIDELYKAIGSGEIKAGQDSADTATYILSKGQYPDIKLVQSYVPVYSGPMSIAVRKGDPLLAKIDAALAKLKADGTLAALAKKWSVVAPK